MAGAADPKPPRRKKDPDAVKRARLAADCCAVCGRSDGPFSMHHLLFGADGRHDEAANLLPLCGSGTTGCHGKAHHADSETLRRIGGAIATRPATIRFMEERLGKERGRDYLRRRYGLVLDEGVTPDPKPERKAKPERRKR